MLGGLLAGCAALPTQYRDVPPDAWALRAERLQAVRHWVLRGKISVQSEEDVWHGTIYWKQRDDGYDVRVLGPLGQGAIRITADGAGVKLELARGEVYTASDPDALLLAATGLRIPLSGLTYWVRGLPQPGSLGHVRWDSDGRLASLEQSGWQVEFLAYTRTSDLDLPAKVALQHPQVSVRLVVQQWTLT